MLCVGWMGAQEAGGKGQFQVQLYTVLVEDVPSGMCNSAWVLGLTS